MWWIDKINLYLEIEMSCTFEFTWEDSKPNRHLNIVFNFFFKKKKI